MTLINEKIHKNNLFKSLIFSYIIVLITPLIICFLVYMQTIEINEKNAKEGNLVSLQQIRNITDLKLKEIDSTAKQIALEPRILNLINLKKLDEGSAEYYKVWEAVNNLPKIKLLNNFIYDYCIFIKDINICISSDLAIRNMEFFYKKTFMYSNIDYSTWNNLIWNEYHYFDILPSTYMELNGKRHKVINYMQSIPYDSRLNAKGVINIFIDETRLHSFLRGVNIEDDGMVFISNDNNEILTVLKGRNCDFTPEDVLDKIDSGDIYKNSFGNKLIISSVKSSLNNWNYISAVPYKTVMSKADNIRNTTITFFILSFFIGLALASYFSYNNTKPMKVLLLKVRALFENEKNNSANEYEQLDSAISNLLSNNNYLQNKMVEHRSLIKATFLRRLLYGEFSSENEIRTFMKNIELDFKHNNFVVLILRIEGYDYVLTKEILNEFDMINVIIKDILSKSIDEMYYLYDIDEKNTAIILNPQGESIDEYENYIQSLIDNIQETLYLQYSISTFISIGNIYNNILNISSSFREALNILYGKKYEKKCNFLWYKHILKESDTYYYPIELELHLINAVKLGNIEELKKIIELIYIENFNKKQLSIEMKEQLVYSMKNTIIREIDSNKYGNDFMQTFSKLDTADTIEDIFNNIVDANLEICNLINAEKKNDKEEFKNKIINFIENSYNRYELSLYDVASNFGVTESYLYQFFKENIGVTFSTYLENVRIRHACELLSQTATSIKNIAELIGYCNDNSFRRAFKRVINVSPSEYQNAARS
jgi:two-component system, response regulator YesN